MEFVDWGLIPYVESTGKQLELVESVASGQSPDTIIFCSHPPVVTLGRSSLPEDLKGWEGETVEVSRGGKATYHGPDQLVIYPILDLKKERKNLRTKDVHHYLRSLEQSMVNGLEALGVNSEVRETKSVDAHGRELLFTGVWVGDKKLVSLGIAVRKWVSYHGTAMSLFPSESAFHGISPCGFSAETMTSLQEVAGQKIDRSVVVNAMKTSLSEAFRG